MERHYLFLRIHACVQLPLSCVAIDARLNLPRLLSLRCAGSTGVRSSHEIAARAPVAQVTRNCRRQVARSRPVPRPSPARTDRFTAIRPSIELPARTLLPHSVPELADSPNATPVWMQTVVASALVRYFEALPGVELALRTAPFAERLRYLENRESDPRHRSGHGGGALRRRAVGIHRRGADGAPHRRDPRVGTLAHLC